MEISKYTFIFVISPIVIILTYFPANGAAGVRSKSVAALKYQFHFGAYLSRNNWVSTLHKTNVYKTIKLPQQVIIPRKKIGILLSKTKNIIALNSNGCLHLLICDLTIDSVTLENDTIDLDKGVTRSKSKRSRGLSPGWKFGV